MSGHSKWAQIKHKKAITDAKKGQVFSKISREIMIAAKSGGPNPETNSGLRTAMERAREQGLPKDNIARAIARAAGTDATDNLQEFLYEATAPDGVLILMEGITDNKNRTLAEIKHLLSGLGGKLAEQGAVSWNFDKIGIIKIGNGADSLENKEALETAIIESGARDFYTAGDDWIIETEAVDLARVRKNFETGGIVIKSTRLDYKPKSPLALPESSQTQLLKLLDALAEQNDVQEVYTNIGD